MKLATPACLAHMPVSEAALIERYRTARSNLWAGPPAKPEPEIAPEIAPEAEPEPTPVVMLAPAIADRVIWRGEEIAKALPPIGAPPAPKVLKVETILRTVARVYDLPYRDLMSARRTQNIVRPRQLAMWLAKRLTLQSLPEIGRRFGGKDHTTVLHAVRKIERLRLEDPELADELQRLEAELRPPEEEAHEGQEERQEPRAEGAGDDHRGAGHVDRAAQ
jgi:hypothetical protein